MMSNRTGFFQSGLKLSHKGLLLVSIPLIFELIFVTVLVFLLHQAEAEIQREAHARAITTTTTKLAKDMWIAHTRVRHTLFKPKGPDLDVVSKDIREDVEQLKSLFKDSPTQLKMIKHAEKEMNDLFTLLKWMRNHVAMGRVVNPVEFMRKTGEHIDALEYIVSEDLMGIVEEQKKIQKESPKIQAHFRRLVEGWIAGGIAINVLLAVVLALYFSKGTAARLEVLMDNTRRLAEDKPLNPPQAGSDEIAQLDRTFNDMAKALATARRKERAIIENSVDVICSLDEDGIFTAVSPACSRILAYQPEELQGSKFIDAVNREDREIVRRAVEKLKETGTSGTFDCLMQRKDETNVDMAWSAQWSNSEKALFAVGHDVTQRKELERMKQEFMAMVSHDIRTPLCSLQFINENLRHGVFGDIDPKGREILASSEKDIDRLIGLVNDLLETAKADAGRLDMEFKETSLESVLQQSVQSVLGYADEHNVSFEADFNDCQINADHDRLVQVVVNLLSNAIKFSPDGGQVSIRSTQTDSQVRVEVIDKGPGIPSDRVDSIFDAFTQLKSPDGKKRKGTGLGLAICKGIIEGHGGEIGAQSEMGKGSTFWFRIPVQSEAA